jgi:hypothetical protein
MRVENKMSEANWMYGDVRFDNLIGEVVTKELNQGYHHFYLPVQYGDQDGYNNPPVEDPLTIRFGTTAFSDDDGLLFEASLTDIIDDMIEMHRYIRENKTVIGKEDVPMFTKLAQGLQNEVNKLNALIDNAVEE